MLRFRRRQPARIVLAAALVPVALVVPGPDVSAPSPVPPAVSELPVAGVDGSAATTLPGPLSRPPRLLTKTLRTRGFSTVGVTWAAGAVPEDIAVQVRTRTAGTWSDWRSLDYDPEEAPDAGSADAEGLRDGTAPLWVGDSDGVQVRVDGARPRDVKVALVDPGRSAADLRRPRLATAYAEAAQPAVVTREEWGADESIRTCSPSYGRTIKAGFVHHTAGSNTYTQAQSASVVRGIYAFHVKSRGWCDVGYQFLVDKYGTVYEGRFGGIDRPVIGAHAAGLNTDTFGASLMGDFSTVVPPQVMLDALQRLLAWKLALHHRDPLGTVLLTSGGGGTARYPAGTTVRFDVVSGHRDGNNTSCPGEQTYQRLGAIRTAVGELVGPGLVDPSVSASSVKPGGSVTISAKVREQQTWQVTVSSDTLLRTWSGATGTGFDQTWDLKDGSGVPVPPGSYRVDVTSAAGSEQARPWSTTVQVLTPSGASVSPSASPSATPSKRPTPPASPSPTTAPAVPGSAYVPLAPTRILDTRWAVGAPRAMLTPNQVLDVRATGVAGVPSSDVAAVVLNLTGTMATAGTYLTAFPTGEKVPTSSSLSLPAGVTAASLVVAAVGRDGTFSIYNRAGSVHAIADVLGYYPAASADGSLYHPLQPARVLDTRRTGAGGAYTAGESRVVRLAGTAGVPSSGATGVVLNVTAVSPTVAGYLSVSPAKSADPGTSTVNFAAGQTVPNRVMVPVAPDGSVAVFNSHGSTHVLVDVVGWYAAPAVTAGTTFRTVPPVRLYDTRSGGGSIGPAGTTTVQIAGRGGVPATARAVVVTMAAVSPTHLSYLTAWPAGTTRPGSSDLNYVPQRTVSNLSVVPVGRDGAISLYNHSGWTHAVVDVVGWFE